MHRSILALFALSMTPGLAAADIIVGAGPGGGPHVKVFDGLAGGTSASFFPYPPTFSGGVRVAVGDVDGDGVADIITGAGPGGGGSGGSHVKVFDGVTGAEIRSFFAFGATPSAGGVYVASGDINGDGFAEIVAGSDAGAAPHVRTIDGQSGLIFSDLFPYTPSFTGGVRVAVGDINGDGQPDVITGTGPGAAGHVKVFDGVSGLELRSFFAYTPAFTGGVYVASGDVDGDGFRDIITGTDAGAAAHVKAFSGQTGAEIRSFLPYGAFSGGVRVAVGDLDGDGFADIITGAGPGAGPHVKVFSGQSGLELQSFFAFDGGFDGGVYVAAIDVPEPMSALLLLSAALLLPRRRRNANVQIG